jgi:hypothetical protein
MADQADSLAESAVLQFGNRSIAQLEERWIMIVTGPVQRAAAGWAATGSEGGAATPLLAHVTPRRIEGVPGPEDVVIDHEFGVAYVSSQIREPNSAPRSASGRFCRRAHADPQTECDKRRSWRP